VQVGGDSRGAVSGRALALLEASHVQKVVAALRASLRANRAGRR
jgi:hypothetical protein